MYNVLIGHNGSPRRIYYNRAPTNHPPSIGKNGNKVRDRDIRGMQGMRLYEEVVKKINLTGGGDLFGCARCTLIFGGGGYFEGVRGIVELSENKVVFTLKSGVLEIIGERLGVEKYLDGDVELSGKILTVALTDAAQKTTQQTHQTQQTATKPTAQTAPKTANTTVENGGNAR